MPSQPSTSSLTAFGRFLVFGMVGTLAGKACVEVSRGIWSASPTPFAGLIPLLSYVLLIFAVCRLRFRQREALAHGILLLDGIGLLLALLPYAVLVAPYHSSGDGFRCILTLAFISAVMTRWTRLFLAGQKSAVLRGIFLLFGIFITFVIMIAARPSDAPPRDFVDIEQID